MKINLESIDASLCIYVNKINIPSEEVAKITHAWAEGHAVVVSFNSWYGSELKIDIRTVNNATQLQRWEEDITRDWRKIAKVLIKGQLPQEWLQVIEEIRHVKGHVCI